MMPKTSGNDCSLSRRLCASLSGLGITHRFAYDVRMTYSASASGYSSSLGPYALNKQESSLFRSPVDHFQR